MACHTKAPWFPTLYGLEVIDYKRTCHNGLHMTLHNLLVFCNLLSIDWRPHVQLLMSLSFGFCRFWALQHFHRPLFFCQTVFCLRRFDLLVSDKVNVMLRSYYSSWSPDSNRHLDLSWMVIGVPENSWSKVEVECCIELCKPQVIYSGE